MLKKTTTLKPTMSKINHHPPTPKVFLFYMKHFYSVKPFRIWRLSKNQSPELWNPLLKMFDNYTFGRAAIANVALLISLQGALQLLQMHTQCVLSQSFWTHCAHYLTLTTTKLPWHSSEQCCLRATGTNECTTPEDVFSLCWAYAIIETTQSDS